LGFPIALILGGLIVLLASLGVFSDAWGWIWPILILLLGAGWLYGNSCGPQSICLVSFSLP
jgi:hypothetical protein